MKNLKNKITKILNSKNIFDADFFFCDAEEVGNFALRSHTEKKESDSQVFCVSFTHNNNHELAIDDNFAENLVNILTQNQ